VDELVTEGSHVGREVDDPKAILRPQRLEQLAAGRLRLGQLPSAHRAGDVEHQCHVARRRPGSRRARRRQGDQREAVFSAWHMLEHRDCGCARAAHRQKDRDVACIPAHGDTTPATVTIDVELVSRRVGFAYALVGRNR
jgi:hypothetical protein